MPNELTQTFSKSVPRNVGRKAKAEVGDEIDDDALSSMEQIRQDLDDADNVFGVLYANKPLRKKRGSVDILHQSSRGSKLEDGLEEE